jgi:hypothetical protein
VPFSGITRSVNLETGAPGADAREEKIMEESGRKPGVWILYVNEPGCWGRVVATFSSAEKGMNNPTAREMSRGREWERRNTGEAEYWLCFPEGKSGRGTHLSLELSAVDRLVEDDGDEIGKESSSPVSEMFDR